MIITNLIDFIIIVSILLMLYKLLRRTEAMKILYGLFFVFIIYLITDYLQLNFTASIFKKIFDISPLGLVIIFHKEIRMALRKIGGLTGVAQEKKGTISSIEDAVFNMASENTGALIIFDPEEKVTFQTDNRILIDAVCTGELLETIFFRNSRLHDGAVIIQNGRISYAGCKLPLTGGKRPEYEKLGTRHLAALETAEAFDVIGIVVSEERGTISIATNKGLREIDSRKKFRIFFREMHAKNKNIAKVKRKISMINKNMNN